MSIADNTFSFESSHMNENKWKGKPCGFLENILLKEMLLLKHSKKLLFFNLSLIKHSGFQFLLPVSPLLFALFLGRLLSKSWISTEHWVTVFFSLIFLEIFDLVLCPVTLCFPHALSVGWHTVIGRGLSALVSPPPPVDFQWCNLEPATDRTAGHCHSLPWHTLHPSQQLVMPRHAWLFVHLFARCFCILCVCDTFVFSKRFLST